MNAAGLIIFLSFITFSFGIPIIQDDSQTELLPENTAQAYLYLADKSMTYCFDFTPIIQVTDLLEWIRLNCAKYPLASQAVYHQILDVDLWSDKKLEKPIQTDFLRTSSNLGLIHIYVDKFVKHVGIDKCRMLPNITQGIYDFNTEIIALSKRNFSLLHNLITREQFQYDVKRIIYDQSANSSTLPFDLDENFDNFLKLAKIRIESYKNFLYLTFQVPAFSKQRQNIYQVYPKPIVYQNMPYILKPNHTRFLNYANRSVLLPNDAIDRCCVEIMRNNFCDFFGFMKDHISDDKRDFFERFPKEYFEKLPRRNVATKVRNDFYFTVFSPFDLAVTCSSSEFVIRVVKSSKILNNTDCVLKSLFFEFDPANSNDSYAMIVSELTTNTEDMWNEGFDKSPQLSAIHIMYCLILCFAIIAAILSFLNIII